MTDKELHKLRRQDLLQLLLSQSKDVASQQERISELERANAELTATCDRLKNRLDDKDALIEKLKGRLDKKDADIRTLREGGTIEADGEGVTGAIAGLEEIFAVAKNAAEQYMRQKSQAAGDDNGKTGDGGS